MIIKLRSSLISWIWWGKTNFEKVVLRIEFHIVSIPRPAIPEFSKEESKGRLKVQTTEEGLNPS